MGMDLPYPPAPLPPTGPLGPRPIPSQPSLPLPAVQTEMKYPPGPAPMTIYEPPMPSPQPPGEGLQLPSTQLALRPEEATALVGTGGPAQQLSFAPGKVPFTRLREWIKQADADIDYTTSKPTVNAPGEEQVQRTIAFGGREAIDTAVDDFVRKNPEMAGTFDQWKAGKDMYHVAETVRDPAYMSVQPEYGTFPFGGALSEWAQHFIPGTRQAAAGGLRTRTRNLAAGVREKLGEAAAATSGFTKGLPKLQGQVAAQGATNMDNEELKSQIESAKEKGWDWARQLLGVQ